MISDDMCRAIDVQFTSEISIIYVVWRCCRCLYWRTDTHTVIELSSDMQL